MFGALHLAPITQPHKILDIGTGTGIWAIEMAEKYTSAHMVGIDITPIQPELVPPNVQFLLEDAEDLSAYDDNSFDLVHIRAMAG